MVYTPILKPDKGNGHGVVIRSSYKLISCDKLRGEIWLWQWCVQNNQWLHKFKSLKEDPTLLRESQLQWFLRKLKTKVHLDPKVYSKIYPSGSRPARIYGLQNMHKPRGLNTLPPFRPIVSSIGTNNYELAKFLCSLLQPYIPDNYCAQDSFTFVDEIQDIPLSGNFMV